MEHVRLSRNPLGLRSGVGASHETVGLCRRRIVSRTDDQATIDRQLSVLLHADLNKCATCSSSGGGFYCGRCNTLTCRDCVSKRLKQLPAKHDHFQFVCAECSNDADAVW